MAWIRARYRRADQGFTLVELLCAMFLFAVVLTIISGATISMVHSLRKQQGQSDNLDGSRKALELLDHQVRYANAVAVPGTNAAATAQYAEFQLGNTQPVGQPQTCDQWRLDTTTKLMQYRSWPAVAAGVAATTTTGSVSGGGWVTQVTGAVQIGSTSVFTMTQAVAPATSATASASPTPTPTASSTAPQGTNATLTVTFATVHGVPATSTQNTVTLASVNATTPTTGVAVCAPTSVDGGNYRP